MTRISRARVTLCCVAALSIVAAGLPARAQSPSPSPAQSPSAQPSAQPSAAPSAAPPTGPAIALLNPSVGYDPGLPTAGDPAGPRVSDKPDGHDSAYHIVAAASGVGDNAIVEAYLQYGSNLEQSLGLLERSPDNPDQWELDWEIPDTFAEGSAVMRVSLFEQSAGGLEELASDEVGVVMRHRAATVPKPSSQTADDTLAITWPPSNGKLGFYQPRAGGWYAGIIGTVSGPTQSMEVFYSTDFVGTKPTYTKCGRANRLAGALPGKFGATCKLAEGVLPEQVTAIAAVAETGFDPGGSTREQIRTQESADAVRVLPYVQQPDDAHVTVTSGRALSGQCAPIFNARVNVTDGFGGPIVGANVDIHARGPDDQLKIIATGTTSTQRAPDKGPHSAEPSSNCAGTAAGDQGDHNVPGGADIKHRESIDGTGLSGPAGVMPGAWEFQLRSTTAGIAEVTAWIDDEMPNAGAATRPLDDDMLGENEAHGSSIVQWYAQTPRVSIDPAGSIDMVGSCVPYAINVRSANRAVPFANVDLHVTGPTDDVRTCDLGGQGSEVRPPNSDPPAPAAPHEEAPDGSMHHEGGENPDTLHVEGETDKRGRFIVGLTSPEIGDTNVVAWLDGESHDDDDVPAGNEPRSTATLTWFAPGVEAFVSFLNPSPYGGSGSGGSGNGTQLNDLGGTERILVRVEALTPPDEVEVELAPFGTQNFRSLGSAERIDGTEVYELIWDVDAADANYVMRASIADSDVFADVPVKVGAGDQGALDPYESASISRPSTAGTAVFRDGTTRITGVASDGADAVDLFYTKAPPRSTPQAGDWLFCGWVALDPLADSPQPFEGECGLLPGDQASQVTGVAAIAFDCTVPGCDPQPNPAPPSQGVPAVARTGSKEAGDAVRVFGLEGQPMLSIEPPEALVEPGVCRRYEVNVTDQLGQPLVGENVDLHLTGLDKSVNFCDPGGLSGPWRAPDQGGHLSEAGHPDHGSHQGDPTLFVRHIEADVPPRGDLVIGITAAKEGDLTLEGWLDRNDDDASAVDELADTALLHVVEEVKGSTCTVIGTKDADHLVGTNGPDRICGLGGNDVLIGLSGRDVLLGGSGNDLLRGGKGRDRLLGGPGRDRLLGGAATNRCRGGPARDRLTRCGKRKH